MALLAARFDESETAGKLLIVAGYVSRVPRWKQFHREWCEALIPEGLDPQQIPFHMAEFVARKQPHMKGKTEFLQAIANWDDEKCDRVLGNLTQIVNQQVAVGVAVALVLPDWDRVTQRRPDAMTSYTFCVLRCLWQVVAWADHQHEREDIAYVFEDGATKQGAQEIKDTVTHIYARDYLRERHRMGGLVFGKKKKYVELQAADIGAWEARRYCLTVGPRSNEGLRWSLQTLLHGLPHYTEYWDEKELRRLARHIQNMPRP